MRPKSGRRLSKVITYCARVTGFLEDVSQSTFLGSDLLQDAVSMGLLQVGEQLTDLRDNDPEVFEEITDGPSIIGLRHRLAHDYDRTDFETIYRAVKVKVPILQVQAADLLSRFHREYDIPTK